jgi:hypothetical protein
VDWNPQPGIEARLRIVDETFVMPAITLGFASQGYGAYSDSLKRYTYKSRGAFAVASKNYQFFYNLGFHGGLNYSFENDDGNSGLNGFLGLDLSFTRELRIMAEYDFARNDNNPEWEFGSGKGYLNGGVIE